MNTRFHDRAHARVPPLCASGFAAASARARCSKPQTSLPLPTRSRPPRPPPRSDPRTLEYKYVVVGEGGAECATWKPGGNYSLAVPPAGGGLVQVRDAWDEASREVLVEVERAARARRRRRRADGGGAGSEEEEEEAEAIAAAAARSLGQLEAMVALSEGLMAGAGGDAGAAELVAADRMLAAAAARAAALARACDAATDSRALPPPP